MRKLRFTRFIHYGLLLILSLLCLLFGVLTRTEPGVSFVLRIQYSISNFSGSWFDPSGKLTYFITSASIWKFIEQGKIFMNNLNIRITSGGNTYSLQATDGWFEVDKNIGHFGKEVIITEKDNSGKIVEEIRGENINLLLNQGLLTSTEEAQITQKNVQIKVKGWQYDLKADKIFSNAGITVQDNNG